MQVTGKVHNGVVVLDDPASLPEGACVRVVFPVPPSAALKSEKRRIQLPLVHCDRPGTLHLTNEQIAEILDDEDAAPRH
jgi:hypothetical protein